MHAPLRTRIVMTALAVASSLLLAACGGSDPLDDGDAGSKSTSGETIVVGSQDYYSSEIIAEIYAQALEDAGYDVEREFRIGQREVYMPEVEKGEIDLFPEYTGPLLQYWDKDATATTSDDVYAALVEAAPEEITILEQAPATDQDSYVVTREFAEEHDLETVADLKNVKSKLTLGANSEAETRPNGPKGIKRVYGIDVAFTPIEDGGGPLTIKALKDDSIQIAIVYTGSPTIKSEDLVVLEDPEGLFLASHVVPIASDKLDEKARELINELSADLTSEELLTLNARSVDEQAKAEDIARAWLAER